jgi:hypothetical protein
MNAGLAQTDKHLFNTSQQAQAYTAAQQRNASAIDATDAAQARADASAAKFTAALLASDTAAISNYHAFQALASAIDASASAASDMGHAIIDEKQGLADLKTSIKDNGHQWDLNTQAGRNNMGQLYNSLDAAKQLYDTQVKQDGATAANTAAYDKNVNALLAVAKQAGLSKKQIDALRTAYEDIPATKTLTIKVKTTGNLNALTMAQSLGQRYAGANSGVYPGYLQKYANSGVAGNIAHYDATGIYNGTPGGIYRFAESSTRKEALIAQNGDIGRAVSSLATAASWFGGAVMMPGPTGTSPGAVSTGGGGTRYMQPIVVQIGGRTLASFVAELTPVAQQRKLRSGVTGLG